MEQSNKRKQKIKRWLPLFVMMAPGLLYVLINNYIPMFGIVIAFKKLNFQKGIFGSDWCGLDNFRFLFTTNDAWVITRNTLLYNIVFILLNMVIGIALAIFICDIRQDRMKKFYQSTVLLPYLMSIVIISYIVYAFLVTENGMLNNSILPLFGKEPVSWYSEPKYWPLILVLVNIWKGIGYGCMIYISSINGIDQGFFEAADLDGATKWQQIRYITLPSLIPSIITLTLLSVGRIFYSDFGLFYQVPLDSGALYSTTNVIDTYVYRGLLKLGDTGMASAAGVYQSLVGFVVILAANAVVRKMSKENALF